MAKPAPPPARLAPAQAAAASVLLAAVLWGLSGTVAQYLMQDAGMSLAWLSSARMALAGVVLLGLAAARDGPRALVAPWQSAGDAVRLVAFGAIGLFLVQYSYLAAIDAANAAAATVLQYTGSGLVVLWYALRARRLPSARQAGALAAALLGIALLATDGSPASLALPLRGLLWGLVAAVTLAAYTILPQPLLRRHATLPVIAWGMLIAAVAAACVLRPAPWPHATVTDLGLVALIVVLGTVTPFTLYLASMRRLPASEAALLANAEPVAAAVVAVLWLGVRLGVWAIAGALLTLGATTALYAGVATGSDRAQAADASAPGPSASDRDGAPTVVP